MFVVVCGPNHSKTGQKCQVFRRFGTDHSKTRSFENWIIREQDKSLLVKFGISSVNQINAQIKLLEMWKALHVEDYPLHIKQQEPNSVGAVTRASELWRQIEISNLTKSTCVSDAVDNLEYGSERSNRM